MITTKFAGKTADGRDVNAYILSDGKNSAEILNYGGIIRKLNIENAEFLNITSADTMFQNCRSLTTLNLGHMNLVSATNLNNFISNAELLSSFNAPKNISVSFKDFTYSIKLGHDDLMTIINNLSTVSTTQTLTLGRTNLAKLTTDEIQIAVDKGWTVV